MTSLRDPDFKNLAKYRREDEEWTYNGYKIIGKVANYRLIYISAHGKPPKGWHIHHIDCNKANDKLENLIALPELIHRAVHSKGNELSRYLTRKEVEETLYKYLKDEDINGEPRKLVDSLAIPQLVALRNYINSKLTKVKKDKQAKKRAFREIKKAKPKRQRYSQIPAELPKIKHSDKPLSIQDEIDELEQRFNFLMHKD